MVFETSPSLDSNDRTTNISIKNKFDRVRLLPINDKLEKWRNVAFYIVGVGGIGFHVAKSIAQTIYEASITLIDREYVEEENLNRFDIDPFYVGLPKVDATAQVIASLNPFIRVHTINADFREAKTSITPNEKRSIIIDEVDSVATSKLIYEYARQMRIPYISMKYNGFDKGTLYVNEIGFDTGIDNPYEISPSAYFSASIFANILVYFMFSHDITEIRSMRLIKNINLDDIIGDRHGV